MWESRTKDDLIIEVWEKLDCESVGAVEIIAIEEAVRGRFGDAAVDSPMVIARLLADEGADLRHSEIMQLYVEREQGDAYDAIFRNILKLDSLEHALSSIRAIENVRKKFLADDDAVGVRLARETALDAKNELLSNVGSARISEDDRMTKQEIADWLSLWLRSPLLFENWITLRVRSNEFVERFGDLK
jgi:hypothetical protein